MITSTVRQPSNLLMLASLFFASWVVHALAGEGSAFDVAGEVTHGPAGMIVAPDGSMIVSLHQSFETRERVIRIDSDGEWQPFPTSDISLGEGTSLASLDSVTGIRSNGRDIVWMLDSGRRGESIPKVVGWNLNEDRLHRVYHLPAPVTLNSSFLADLAIDPNGEFIYSADPASGDDGQRGGR